MSCCATQTEAELLQALIDQERASFDRLQQIIQAIGSAEPPEPPAGPCAGPCEYGYFHNQAVSSTVAINASFPFDSEGPKSAGILHTPSVTPAISSEITILNAGIYNISYQTTNLTGPTQIALWLDGLFVPGTRVGEDTATAEISGVAIIAIAAGQILTMRNDSSPAAVTLDPNQGGSALVNTNSLTIWKVA